MAQESDFTTDTQPTLQQLGDYIVEKLFDVHNLARLETAIANAVGKGQTNAKAAADAASVFMAEFLGTVLGGVEKYIEPVMGPSLSKLAGHLVGVDLSTSELRRSAASGGEGAIGDAVSKIAFQMLSAPEGELQPGSEAARRFLGTMAQLVFNGWFEATAFEMLVTLVPDMDSFESVAELPHELINALGLSRLSRVALRPLAQHLVATPLDWELSKRHRPKLLSEADIMRAFLRGDYTNTEAAEELGRLGYSDTRQNILLKNALKNISLDDALVLERHGVIDRALVLEKLKQQGYDDSEAQFALVAAEAKRQTTIDDNAIGALTRAYVKRDIDQSAFRTLFPPNVYTPLELDTYETQARLERDLNVRHLSEGDVIRAVRLEVVPMAYYRGWMTREGIPEDEQLIKELLLRAEIEKEFKVEHARASVLAERAAEKAARDQAAKEHQARIEAERALARRGPVSELVRAVVRGLIPAARLQEVLAAQYDPDTVSIFLDDAAEQRAAFVEQEQKAEALKNRALVRHVDVAALEQAVLNDILTLDQFRQALINQSFAPADADLLTATLRVRKADNDAAKQKRADAEARAKRKAIDLTKYEQLVRRGVHTLDEYAALIRSLGFDDAAIADMVELLRLQMADDEKARQARAAAAAVKDSKGLTLADARRAVVLEVQTIDWFQGWLVANKFTTDAQAILTDELRVEVDQARAARERRHAADLVAGASRIPLTTVARAARLGLITPALYQQQLRLAGYSDDDIAIELALLTQEITDIQAARAKQAAAVKPAAPGVLTLTQMAAAVRAGVRPLSAYEALAVADGLDEDSVATLVRVLGDEIAGTTAARLRRAQLGSQLQAKDINLSLLEAQVRAGGATLSDYHDTLVQAGLDPVDVALLTSLLSDETDSAGIGG